MPRHEPMEDRLCQDSGLALFYDLENQGASIKDDCRWFANDAQSALDPGYGTGQMAACLADIFRNYAHPLVAVIPP